MRESWKFTIGLLAISYWLFAAPAQALPEIKRSFPRLANYFLHWTISEQEARELARFDLVILDAEAQERSRAQLQLIRKLNPRIILLAYIPASEIRRDVVSLREIAPLRYKLGAAIPDNWYLKDAAGLRQSFWPGTWIVNVVDRAPLVGPGLVPGRRSAGSSRDGEAQGPALQSELRWNEYLPQFVAQEILSTGLWDGVFYDNAWDDIVHFARGVPDINGDGLTDNASEARRAWQDGVRQIYRRTAELAPNYFVFENDGPIYAPEVHGVLLESFPRKGWARHREELLRVRREARNPKVAILNANTFNTGRRDDYRAARYGLTTAFLHDAFYSFDFGDQDHGQTWWYDEYGVFLGEPVRDAQSIGPGLVPGRGGAQGPALQYLYRRDFENGIVLVNPSDEPQEVALALEVEKIRGLQDPAVNNGRITRTLQVAQKDGLVVLRPLEIILGAAYENGVLARVFNARGEAVRAGFFTFDKAEESGTLIARIDLDGDVQDDRVRVQGGRIEVVFSDGRRSLFAPFGTDWQGEISVDFGDVNQDGIVELVVGMGPHPLRLQAKRPLPEGEGRVRGATQVRMYRPNGTQITFPFFPFGPNYRGGAQVAVGDLNADGFSEIVVGAGPGGGPQVRIFSGDGRLLSGGFFAYDPRFRGGVRVAVGDTDGDGSAEIITGPGPGGGPQIRLFDGKGRALSPGFFAFDRASRAGAIPIVADIDGDGRNEILAVTKDIL